ncbi:MAG TPA: DUF1194 domain-containing protein [Acetobacteraceae bacterium]|nr:DUF1194 domain-containing protein [Acetobacteraceae bacterium]
MRAISLYAACAAAAFILVRAHEAAAATPVDIALVLLDDVSGSINADEYKLQKEGYLAAFNDPRVIEAIGSGPVGAIAVTFEEFAGAGQVASVVDWTVIRDAAGAKAFGERVHDAPRSAWGHTAIGDGITLALQSLASSGVEPTRRVIDIAGDGTNNAGRPVEEARDEAARDGVTINGLAIANESNVPWLQAHTHPPGGLDNYYREHVTAGETSFVLIVHDYNSFGEAIVRKLVSEIAATRPRQGGGVGLG